MEITSNRWHDLDRQIVRLKEIIEYKYQIFRKLSQVSYETGKIVQITALEGTRPLCSEIVINETVNGHIDRFNFLNCRILYPEDIDNKYKLNDSVTLMAQ